MHLLCAIHTLAPLGALSAQIPTSYNKVVRGRGGTFLSARYPYPSSGDGVKIDLKEIPGSSYVCPTVGRLATEGMHIAAVYPLSAFLGDVEGLGCEAFELRFTDEAVGIRVQGSGF